MSLRHGRLETACIGQNHLLADEHDDKLNHHHKRRASKRKRTTIVVAFMVCLFGCVLCFISTFQVLRELTIIIRWTTTKEEEEKLAVVSSSLLLLQPEHAVHLAAVQDSTVTSTVRRSRRNNEPLSSGTRETTTTSAATAAAPQRPPWVIFYNIYLRPNSTSAGLQSTLRILEDQLDQIGHAYATAAVRNNNNSSIGIDLYYNTIGASDLVDDNSDSKSFFQALCRRNHLNCRHLKHYEEGFETRTLAEALKYCQKRNQQQRHTDDENDDDRVVIYLHNKGSFHDAHTLHQDYPNDSNSNDTKRVARAYSGQDSWRRAMTAAATSRQCLEQLRIPEMQDSIDQDDDENIICDACGLLFQPLPYEHYPGNMWAARCSYLARLVNPLTALRTIRADMMQDLFQTSTQRQLLLWQQKQQQAAVAASLSQPLLPLLFQANLFPLANSMTGGDRYLSEYWLGSHPWLRPCDLSKTISLQYWKDYPYPIRVVPPAGEAPHQHPPDDDDSSWKLFHGPRAAIDNVGWEYHKYRNPNTSDLLLVSQDGKFGNNNDGGNGMGILDDHHHAAATSSSTSSSIQQERQYQEFFLLPGRLFKWMYFYNATPRQDSWIWSWFPQGQEWKEQIVGTMTMTAAAAAAANDSDRHDPSSIVANTAAATTTTDNTLEQHHNQTMHRFQQYYQQVTKARSRDTIML